MMRNNLWKIYFQSEKYPLSADFQTNPDFLRQDWPLPPGLRRPRDGYRYYSAAQLDYLDTILIMKKIGFSLSEIKAHMQSYNIDSSLALFKKQLAVIDRQIEELRLIRSRVESRCEQMEASQAHRREADAVTIEEMPEQYLLALPVDPPYTLREISIATKKCFARRVRGKSCRSFSSAG